MEKNDLVKILKFILSIVWLPLCIGGLLLISTLLSEAALVMIFILVLTIIIGLIGRSIFCLLLGE